MKIERSNQNDKADNIKEDNNKLIINFKMRAWNQSTPLKFK